MYKHLAKNRPYLFFVAGLMYRGIYKRRYFNDVLKRWCYVFSMSVGHEFTPFTDETQFFHT